MLEGCPSALVKPFNTHTPEHREEAANHPPGSLTRSSSITPASGLPVTSAALRRCTDPVWFFLLASCKSSSGWMPFGTAMETILIIWTNSADGVFNFWIVYKRISRAFKMQFSNEIFNFQLGCWIWGNDCIDSCREHNTRETVTENQLDSDVLGP